MKALDQAVISKDWKSVVQHFRPQQIVDVYPYEKSMHVVGWLMIAAVDELLGEAFFAEEARNFAVNLMIEIRKRYLDQWQKDWKNEAFLGISCALVYLEEEAFQYLKAAYEALQDPPQSLILAYISAAEKIEGILNKENLLELTEAAVKKGATYQAALQMAFLSNQLGNREESKYWKERAEDAETKEYHTAVITPNILKTIFPIQKGVSNEC